MFQIPLNLCLKLGIDVEEFEYYTDPTGCSIVRSTLHTRGSPPVVTDYYLDEGFFEEGMIFDPDWVSYDV